MKKLFLLSLLLLVPVSAQATQRTLCASNCTYTVSAANLQTAVNASVGGDEVLIQENVTIDAAITLPSHTGASMVTIRTGVTSTGGLIAASQFPAANIRVTPTTAASSHYATIRALTNNLPAFATSSSIGSGGYWTLKHLSITGNQYGGEALIQLGSDSNNAGEQDSLSRVPAQFALVQLYVYGNPVSGQFRGLRIHSNFWTLQDSYVKDIKSNGEGQGIYLNSFSCGVLSAGTYCGIIRNNYIEGASQNVLFGGAGGCCHPNVSVSSATNASTFVVSGHTDAFVGQGISVETVTAGTEEWTTIASCGTAVAGAACTTNNFTVSPALSQTPVTSADVDWGPSPSDVLIEKNTFAKPLAWMNAIIGTPQSVTAVVASGSLPAGAYAYRVTAIQPEAVNTTATSAASAEVTCTLTSAGGCKVTWAAVTNATSYRVYAGSAGAESRYYTVTAPTVTLTETTVAGTAGTVPSGSGAVWYVKNIFELKNAKRITINGNIFDGIWNAQQTGYAILFTVANTGHGNDSTTLEDVTFTNNIVRNAAGVWQIVGRDVSTTSGGQISDRTKRITVSNNLAYNIGTAFGSSVRALLLTTSGPHSYYPNDSASNGPSDVTYNHNSIIQTTGNAPLWFDLFKTTEQAANNFAWNNNIVYKLGYGVTGGNSCAQGSGCFTAHTSGTTSWQKNIVADATCSAYPSGTFCPTSAVLQGEFTDFAANNFALKTTSTYHNAGSDGTDIGATIPTITALTNIATSGDNTGAVIILPPAITTLSLADGQKSAAYSVTVSGTCAAPPCTFASTGTLPSGATLATVNSTTATIAAGSLSAAGTFAFSLTMTDTGGRVSPAVDYAVTVADVVTPPADDPDATPAGCASIPRSDRFNVVTEGGYFRSPTDPCADNKPVRVGDIWIDLSTNVIPMPKLATSLSPTSVWTAFAMRRLIVPVTYTTAGAVTYTAADLLGGLILRDPNGAIRSDVTPTAALIVASMSGAEVGSSYEVDLRNAGAFTVTLTAGTGVTLSGTMTIAQNNTKRFRLVVTNATAGAEAVTLYSIGTFVY
jgi:hypothetical protein